MLTCLSACRKHDVSCPVEECRLWIPSEPHLNCIQEFIDGKAGNINNYSKVVCGMEKEGDGDALATHKEIGDIFGVTREAIRQTEQKALAKLKRKLRRIDEL